MLKFGIFLNYHKNMTESDRVPYSGDEMLIKEFELVREMYEDIMAGRYDDNYVNNELNPGDMLKLSQLYRDYGRNITPQNAADAGLGNKQTAIASRLGKSAL